MNTEKVNQWLQFAGHVAILLGLLFVGLQLYQDRELKSAELINVAWQGQLDRKSALIGESPAVAIAKAAMSPKELSHDETYVLWSYFDVVMTGYERMYRLEELGLITDLWRQLGLTEPFRTEIGKRYLERHLADRRLPEDLKNRWAEEAREVSFTDSLRQSIAHFHGSDFAEH